MHENENEYNVDDNVDEDNERRRELSTDDDDGVT